MGCGDRALNVPTASPFEMRLIGVGRPELKGSKSLSAIGYPAFADRACTYRLGYRSNGIWPHRGKFGPWTDSAELAGGGQGLSGCRGAGPMVAAPVMQ
jgi:hypothetical protein